MPNHTEPPIASDRADLDGQQKPPTASARRRRQRPETGEFSTEKRGQAVGPVRVSTPASRADVMLGMRNHTDQQIAAVAPVPEHSRPVEGAQP
jgi:hypothetical protein